jgi:hypothetical protein
MRVSVIGQTVLALTLAPAPIFACKCVSPPPDAPQGLALWDATRRADVVFEGKVESAELKWNLINAQVGEVIPADIEEGEPAMQLTFEVLRNYSEVDQKHLKIRTGFGGGDCGFPFEVGEQYLVDADKDDSGDLSTSVCSHTALLEDSQEALAYLRGDPEIPETAARNLPRRTGQLCGHLVLDNPIRAADGEVLLFREGSNSLVPAEGVDPEPDGSFCVTQIRPGKYFMVFDNGPQGSPTVFSLFPGVSKLSEAKAIEINEGQQISHLLFKVVAQKTYTVSGKISDFSKRQRQAEPKVLLLNADRLLLAQSYEQEVAPDGTFNFPQVLPGRYWAIVDVESTGDTSTKWSTRKVEVDVDGSIRDLSLELIAN